MTEKVVGQAEAAGATPLPLYQKISNDLRSRIAAREFAVGSYLPTEEKLCAHYQVSRFTIREALRQLQSEGMISRRRGAGTLIQFDGRATAEDSGEAANAASGIPQTIRPGRFGNITTITADARFSQRFGCSLGSRWIARSAVCADAATQEPNCLLEIYLAAHLQAEAERLEPSTQPMWDQIEALTGHRIERVQMRLQSVVPTQSEARALGIAAMAPCLRVINTAYGRDGQVIAYVMRLHPGHSFVYSAEEGRGDPQGQGETLRRAAS